ncbi:MAG: IgGFc-binding protein [Deltaproteobacteria bacterium]|nr:IgGFc-binding protein [Deltaproteobacteria bacterium]
MSIVRTVPWLLLALGAAAASCSFDSSTRWFEPPPAPPPPAPACALGAQRCHLSRLERCVATDDGPGWEVADDCIARAKICAPSLEACVDCLPDKTSCLGQEVVECGPDGTPLRTIFTCDTTKGEACRSAGCVRLCTQAAAEKSNVGCEYWAVDLDNAMISATKNAAAQQFAVVVSNPQPDVPVSVHVFQDDGQPGEPPAPLEVASAVIAPLTLRVFKLGPREVDGSPEGEFDTGTHTALTRHAYEITSDFPVVAYQFNPLENVNVFSNDASLLKPREALTYEGKERTLAYVVSGWPQTIAHTDDPDTNFSAAYPINLRVFLTIVGTQPATNVRVRSTAAVVPGGPVAETPAGGTIDAKLDAFDVLNLETGDFLADFTGTLIEADAPIAVFVGSEASDAPRFAKLSERRCCADHLEEQLDPVRTAGKLFALAHTPSRTAAVQQAGGALGIAPEPEYFRFVAARHKSTTVTTTLPPPDDEFKLTALGDWRELSATRDFLAWTSEPVHVVQTMASQDAASVPRGLPGGDPSLLVVPPREQFRQSYVFLTPDKYAFDFVMIVAPPQATVLLDDAPLADQPCAPAPADGLSAEERGSATPELVVYRCQFGFPSIDPDTGELTPGVQNDGVHRIWADEPVGVTVWGFDAYVSYAYAGGTELREIAPPE